MVAAVCLRNVHKVYNNTCVVNDLSLTIQPGEIFGLLGPNGAGKSTTIRMVTTLTRATQGDIVVSGYDVCRQKAEVRRQIGVVLQQTSVDGDLSVWENMEFHGRMHHLPNPQRQRDIDQWLTYVELSERRDDKVKTLSGGMKRRLQIARALLHQPKILFLDEPTLGLDVNAQVSVRQFLKEYNQRYQATVLLTSHYMADITALCKRVLLIHQGELIYDGNLDQLLSQFAPYREVTVDLGDTYAVERISSFGDLKSLDGRIARLMVRREDLTTVVSRILADLKVVDLKITDPPIEEVIGRVFQSGRV